ncbi:hypothetical protein FRB91_001764 [Serendipita sp. 411]|nr:hypothetical protein FRC20_005386 [Serendipita sp. 405]KAG8845420.1 hypothetical protein FRB91_001764 [Serendipita sp. 411]
MSWQASLPVDEDGKLEILYSSGGLSKRDVESQTPDLKPSLHDEKIVEDEYGGAAPMRKYSALWWKMAWNDPETGMRRRILYSVLGFIFIGAWIGAMLGLVHSEVEYEQENGKVPRHRPGDIHGLNTPRSGYIDGTILLQGSLVHFDIEKRALMITWSGLYRRDVHDDPRPLGNQLDKDTLYPQGIEIFRDIGSYLGDVTFREWENGVLLDTNTSTISYRTDNVTAKPIGVIGAHMWDSFDTEITFTQRYTGNAWRQPLLGYPFDQWEGKIVFVANDRFISDLFTPPDSTAVFGLSGIVLADSTLNWRFNYEYKDECELSDTADWGIPDSLPKSCHLEVTLIGKRPPLLIFCAVAAVFVNWTCALFIFILTCEAIIMRRSYMLKGTDILSMCFTALFALPTIRSLLPGAPAYGAIIDLVGILPCTLIVASCAVCVSVAKLNKRHKAEKAE